MVVWPTVAAAVCIDPAETDKEREIRKHIRCKSSSTAATSWNWLIRQKQAVVRTIVPCKVFLP
jgi:hypothetical protein